MNRERAKELLPIIQAFAEGRKIQYSWQGQDQFYDLCQSFINFSHDGFFRVKPEPRYVWINVYSDGEAGSAHTSKSDADGTAGPNRTGRLKILLEDRFDE